MCVDVHQPTFQYVPGNSHARAGYYSVHNIGVRQTAVGAHIPQAGKSKET